MNTQSSTKTAVPFTFDRSFDREGGGTVPAPKRKMMTTDEIEEIRRAAHDAGRQEGEASAARRQADALNNLAFRVETLAGQLDTAIEPHRHEAVTLGYVVALKIAQVLIRQYPRTEIEALISQCVEEHKSEPHIVLRVNDSLHDEIKSFCDKIAGTRGFQGRIHIIGEPEIIEGDCMIEWADGGLERRMESAVREIDQIVRAYLTASGDVHSNPPPVEDILREPDSGQLSLLGDDDKGTK